MPDRKTLLRWAEEVERSAKWHAQVSGYERAGVGPGVEDLALVAFLREMAGSRDIDSAPRDGTWILAWDATFEQHLIVRRGNWGEWETQYEALDPVVELTRWWPLPQASEG